MRHFNERVRQTLPERTIKRLKLAFRSRVDFEIVLCHTAAYTRRRLKSQPIQITVCVTFMYMGL